MTELYSNVSEEFRKKAEVLWRIAKAQKDPTQMVKFMDNATNYYRNTGLEEEAEFLQFYFNLQLEMMKK